MIYKILMGLIVVALVALNAVLYMSDHQQKKTLELIAQKQSAESEGRLKQMSEQKEYIAQLQKDLSRLKQQFNEQKQVLVEEQSKRQDVENQNKTMKTLVSQQINTIDQNMKKWQKDYVAALAELDQETRGSTEQIKDLEKKINPQKMAEINNRILSLQAELIRMSEGSGEVLKKETSKTKPSTRLNYGF
jgi:uncharacterized small protein (DUF1192 family)